MDQTAMITLHDLINTLDRNLIQAQQFDTGSIMRLETTLERMRKFVLVRIDDERIAIPIEGLAEIGPMPQITRLPNLPGWLHGIINHRGEIISVSDFQMLLDDRVTQVKPKGKLAILHTSEIMAGIGIDQVVTTVSRPESSCVPSPKSRLSEIEPDVFGQCLSVDETNYHILDPQAFLQMERLMRYHLAD